MGFVTPLRAMRATGTATLTAAIFGLAAAGCIVDLEQVFQNSGGQGAGTGLGGGGNGGLGGAGGGTGGFVATMTTSSTGGGGDGGAGATTTTTSTSDPAECGNGICEPGENTGNCAMDCPAGPCAHGVCQGGEALQNGCSGADSECVAAVCGQDSFCCSDEWDGQCIGLANQLCNDMCCGDGVCFGEQCGGCLADCGSCAPEPTCPHRICFGGNDAEPLNTQDCHDPCVDEVCAVIDMDTDNCCTYPNPPNWSAECTDKAKTLCGEYKCIVDVCAAMPSCCTDNWTSACVELAKNTASCDTECNCAHGVCSNGDNNQPLAVGCDPCVDAICAIDVYCCETDWDNVCVGEVATICGIACN